MPATSWTIVMTCGVLSINLLNDHQRVLSVIMMWFTAAVWVFLTVVLAPPLAVHYGRLWREAAPPAVLTIVAATAALGTRLALGGQRTVAAALLVLTAVGWAALSGPVLRRWATPTVGISFLVSVSADSVALLSGTLAVPFGARWLCVAAFLLVLLGLCLYTFAAARFDPRQLLTGRGDHWILGGALAISALSAASATRAAATLGVFPQHHHALTVGTLVLWCVAMAWLPVLIVVEILRPRPNLDLRRWATAFPIGMYAACSFTVGAVAGIGGIVEFARVWTWVAFAFTLVLLVGLAQRIGSSRPGTTLSAPEQPAPLQHQQKGE
ncbi:hypothetical protein HH310_02000 [Actinoplanes sp. TBRC 11911]|uniref:SLAC1 family transporter n=1 Tax=Actinoplanes sp. TBRC 11911 TaxID=2729386 RepID=UPI00145DFBEC|nr:hypothetical protein [Actinoplanes sp. TBRC 11911]NMO49969.1 hypothetical protein [Actinoplanes sp. TBRC 11911]